MENNYHLVLEYRPKDFMPVDINTILNDNKNSYNTLESIDNFTRNYTQEEIYVMIKKSNIVPDEYLDGSLVIINDKKYRYPVVTKDINFTLDKYIMENIDDKIFMNKLVNIYSKYNQDVTKLKKAVQEKNMVDIFMILTSQDYENLRNIYFYIYKLSVK